MDEHCPSRRVKSRRSALWLTLGAVVPSLVGCPVDNRLLGLPSSTDDSSRADGGDSGAPSAETSAGDGGRVSDVAGRGGSSSRPRGSGGSDTSAAGDDGDAGTTMSGGMAGSSLPGAGMAGSSPAGSAGFAGGGAGGIAGGSGASGASGASGQTLGGAGSGAGVGGAGAGSAGHAGTSTVIVCGDIDLNGYDDCSETLARNSSFNSDVNGWQAEYRVVSNWSPNDAGDRTTSGAVSVTFETQAESGPSMAGTWQCVPAISVGFYELGAEAFIPAGQGGGWAGVNVFMFSGDDCGGTLVSGQSLRLEEATGAWLTISGEVHVPPDALSMAVRLVAVKPGNQAALNVLFDNVLLRRE